jgi:hypothetical protein
LFNGGQDRTFIVVTRDVATYGASILGLTTIVDLLTCNFAKVFYVNPDATVDAVLPVMAHEFAHIIFNANRLVAYSQAIGNNMPLGDDASYSNQGAARKEIWINEGLAMLSMLAYGYSPETENRYVMAHLRNYLERPEDFSLSSFSRISVENPEGGPYDNYGGVALFMAYLYGQDPGIIQRLQHSASVSVDAVTDAARPLNFATLFRDFSLALCLDGLSPCLPAKYQIPFIDLQGNYGRTHFRGPSASTSLDGSQPPRHNGLQYTKLHFPNGKGQLELSVSPSSGYCGYLVLIRPSEVATFQAEE